jgi:hypothetical protein
LARRKLSRHIQEQVRQRAQYLCEYCHAAEQWQYAPFTIDHVQPISLGGDHSIDNLALACSRCNIWKSNRVTAIDPESGRETEIFNPRRHAWSDHFLWSADGRFLIPLSAIGRTTISVLKLNRSRIAEIRAADVLVGRHPPEGDPIQMIE